ncbi:hypothetical protein EVAR_41012_1 [Eumeta japonica]|uniref:Uncharacterized protein n=1 Tax=Eumeta variegata TaxID=151549 RepID=A0A4C1YXK9_EUMVA|nr:hypothetical protein EVAR_41012_1 [Eumeta japonica]
MYAFSAAMDTDSIDMVTLNNGYEVFYTIFQFNTLAPHVLKLLYTLSTPSDVNRRRVLNLITLAQMREAKRSDLKGVQVLLGLFKSYKPELVPESVPAVPIGSCFKKLNTTILNRFKTNQVN